MCLVIETGEASKWEKITYLGIVACSVLAFVNLSKGHPHFDEPPVSFRFYIHICAFNWGMNWRKCTNGK